MSFASIFFKALIISTLLLALFGTLASAKPLADKLQESNMNSMEAFVSGLIGRNVKRAGRVATKGGRQSGPVVMLRPLFG